ncbi:hypothetical protein [Candidatus Endolissoclinum faulkneri]|nr:hypothetical protein [Candidatus Endolissoclinum faulkneri]
MYRYKYIGQSAMLCVVRVSITGCITNLGVNVILPELTIKVI